jgi:protein gp37
MSDGSEIEWTDATWNPITGCTMVSAGCTNCYAMGLAGTRLAHHPSRAGLTRDSGGRPVWTGEVRLNEGWLDQPLRWRRPRRIFVCAHGDLFHEGVPDEWIDRVFAVMALSPQHQFQVLTKRPERMRRWFDTDAEGRVWDLSMDPGFDASALPSPDWPLPNVWLGVSVEDQPTADARIPLLLATSAAVRFVSAEPLLGPVDLTRWSGLEGDADFGLDWVIVGGESGPGARPMHPDWARSLRDQCAAAGVAFFFKQWGEWAPHKPQAGGDLGGDVRAGRVVAVHPSGRDGAAIMAATGKVQSEPGTVYMRRVGKRAAGRLLDGRAHDDMPGAAP